MPHGLLDPAAIGKTAMGLEVAGGLIPAYKGLRSGWLIRRRSETWSYDEALLSPQNGRVDLTTRSQP